MCVYIYCFLLAIIFNFTRYEKHRVRLLYRTTYGLYKIIYLLTTENHVFWLKYWRHFLLLFIIITAVRIGIHIIYIYIRIRLTVNADVQYVNIVIILQTFAYSDTDAAVSSIRLLRCREIKKNNKSLTRYFSSFYCFNFVPNVSSDVTSTVRYLPSPPLSLSCRSLVTRINKRTNYQYNIAMMLQ